MKPSTFRYAVPTSVTEALAYRAEDVDSVVLAGGQSLIPTMNFRLANPDLVIDLRRVDELDFVAVESDSIRIGAMARQHTVETSPEIRQANPLIAEVLASVAHPVIRNRGTVCGSLAHADPSAELPTLFATLRGTITVDGPSGRRVIGAEEFFEFIFTTSIEPDELIVEAALPRLDPSEGWAFAEFARRHGDYAVAGVAATVQLASTGTIDRVRLGACGIATVPRVLRSAEELLQGREPSPELFSEAARLSTAEVTVANDATTTQAYRQHVLAGLVERTLTSATARAKDHR